MIQFLHSGLQGAPTNTIAAGSMCGILDACLVDGFNAMAPVSVTVSAGVATLVYASQHGYTADQYLRVAGASVAQVNGDKRPTILDAQTLTVPAAGAPDGAVGGSISTRFAPLGWQTAFSDTNVRVYRSPNVESARMFFRLSDTDSLSYGPAMRGYESMSDANTGFDPFPSISQMGGQGLPFYKSNSGIARPWLLVGDDKTVYFATTDSTAEALYPFCFGDIASGKPGDAFGAILTQVNGSSTDRLAAGGTSGHYIARGSDQVTKSVLASSFSPFANNSGANGSYPSVVNGGATFMWPISLAEGVQLRGGFRGLMHVWEPVPSWPFGLYSGVDGLTGRVLTITCGALARVAFSLDEPW